MARVPIVTRDMVPEEFRDAFDELTKDTGGTITGGPISIIVNSPELARRRAGLTSYLRYESTFFQPHPGAGDTGNGPQLRLPLRLERPRSRRAQGGGQRRTGGCHPGPPAAAGHGRRRAGHRQLLQRVLCPPPGLAVNLPDCPGAVWDAAPRRVDGADEPLRADVILPQRLRGGAARRPHGAGAASGVDFPFCPNQDFHDYKELNRI